MSLEGKRIGRYSILHLLGSGGMGDVYLAEDARIGQQVAIKVIRTELSPYPDAQSAEKAARLFQREARAVVKLDHPHILPLFDYGEERIGDTTLIYLVMPYRQEGSLAIWLRQRGKDELLAPQDVAHIIRQAADALQHAHDHQVVHQDVKPSNFLIRSLKETPGRPDVLLADFGIARLSTATASVSQSIRGTPSYMAPEQWESRPVPATDQYALAVMAYELLTRHLPFQGGSAQMMYQHINVQPPPPSTFNPRLSRELDTVLIHALAKQPEMRFASIIAFANAFQLAVADMQGANESLPLSDSVVVEKTNLTENSVKADSREPTLLNTSELLVGSDDETYLKQAPDVPWIQGNAFPGNVRVMRARVTNTGAMKQKTAYVFPSEAMSDSRADEIVDLPVKTVATSPPSRNIVNGLRSRAGRRPLFVVGLILFMLTLVAGSIGYAFFTTRTAAVTIIPVSSDLKNTYKILAVTATFDSSQRQVGARVVSVTTPTQSQRTNATGTVEIPGTHATGRLVLYSFDGTPTINLSAGYIIPNQWHPSIHMMLDAAVVIPGGGIGNVYAPAHVVEVGTIGNLPIPGTESQLGFYYCSGPCHGPYWGADAYTAFTGGIDPKIVRVVQQSDIDGLTNTLEKANTPAVLQKI